jgi:acetyltransferase
MYKYSQWKQKPLPVEIAYRRDLSKAQKAIQEARSSHLLELVEFQAQELFRAYEMPMLKAKLARTSEEAIQIAKQFGQPVALKIASPQIPHKTDVNGVVLGLESPAAIRNAFTEITSRAKRLRREAYIAGCLVQTMAPKESREVIVGFKHTERFGPLVIFGLGGIHVEVFKDISCRLAPLSLEDVNSMIREIRAFPILAGSRGEKSINFTALEDILFIMSQLAQDFPEIEEAECNPVLVSEQSAVAADMRIILSK